MREDRKPSTTHPPERRPPRRRRSPLTIMLVGIAVLAVAVLLGAIIGDDVVAGPVAALVLLVPLTVVVVILRLVLGRRRSSRHRSALAETAEEGISLPDAVQPVPQPLLLTDLLAMTPTEFEQLCVRALLAIGYRDVVRTGGAGDLGADITAMDPRGRSTVVQCKRYEPGSNIGSPTVQTFIGMLIVHHQADRGIIITTSGYSRPAIKLAKRHHILLIDGDDLIKIISLVGTR